LNPAGYVGSCEAFEKVFKLKHHQELLSFDMLIFVKNYEGIKSHYSKHFCTAIQCRQYPRRPTQGGTVPEDVELSHFSERKCATVPHISDHVIQKRNISTKKWNRC
jgi:hypothetical protein